MGDSSDDSYIKKHKRKRKSKDRERKSKKKKKSERRKRRKKEKDDYDSSSQSRRSNDSSSYDGHKKTKRKRHRCEDDEEYRLLVKSSKSDKGEQSSPSVVVDKEMKYTTFQQDPSTPSTAITTELNDKSISKPEKRSMAPMTKEEYEKQQSTIREVYDPQSGRYRLVRGTGEIIERIVSRNDHQRINQIATRNDGLSFSMNISNEASRRNRFPG